MADFQNPDQAADFLISTGKKAAAPQPSGDLLAYTQQVADDLGLDRSIATRLINTESGGRADAVSPKGAFGPAQLMPDTARDLANRYGGDPSNPHDNIRLGLTYLRDNLSRFGGDYGRAVAAYHAGPGAVTKAGGIPNTNDGIMDTAAYVRRIVGGQGAPAQVQDPQAQPFKFHSPDEFSAPVSPAAAPDSSDAFVKGAKRAFAQVPELGYGVAALGAMTGEALAGEGGVFSGVRDWAVNRLTEKQKENQQYAPPIAFDDALEQMKTGNVPAFVEWLKDAAGYSLGQGAQMLATGGVGSLVGKTALKGAATHFVGEAVKREAAKAAAEFAAANAGKELAADAALTIGAQRVASSLGQGLALGATNVGMEAGDIGQGLDETLRKEGRSATLSDVLRAWGSTLAAAGVETATDKLGLDVLTGKIKVPGIGGRATRAAVGAGVGMGTEGATEYAQTGIEQYGAQQALDTPEAERERREAAAMGAVGGGMFGVAGGALGHVEHGQEIAKPAPFVPVEPQAAPKLDHSPLTNAAAAANTPDPITQRLGGVEAWLNDANNIRAMRAAQGFGPESVSEVLSAYSIAKNPTLDPMTREKALTGLEQNMSHFANRPDWVFSTAQEAPAAPGTAVAPIGSTAVGPAQVAPDTNTLNGQAREIVDSPALARPAIATNEPNAVALQQRSALRIGGITRAIANGAKIVGNELRAKDGRVLFRNLAADEIAPFARQLAAQSNVSQEPQAAPALGSSVLAPEVAASNQEMSAPEQAPNISGFDTQIHEAAPNTSPEASNIPATAAEPGPLEEGKTPDDWFKPVVPSGMFFADWVKAQGKAIPQAGSEEWQKARAAYKAYQAGEQAAPAVDPVVAQQAAEKRAAITAAANEAATSPLNDKPEPTEAQKAAGNYSKGHVRLQGFDITIEQPNGSVRRGTDEDGNEWATEMAADYGYIKRTEGADGEHVDVFVGEHPLNDTVYVVDQRQPDGTGFDEHKVVMAAANRADAERIYRQSYTPDWKGFGGIAQMTHDQFKDWLARGDLSRPAAEWIAKEDAAKYRPTSTEEVWTSAEVKKTGAKIRGNTEALYGLLMDLLGKGVVRRDFGVSVAVKNPESVLASLPQRVEQYVVKGVPADRQSVTIEHFKDGGVDLIANGSRLSRYGSVSAAIIDYVGQFEQSDSTQANSRDAIQVETGKRSAENEDAEDAESKLWDLVSSGSISQDEAERVTERAKRAAKIERDRDVKGDYINEYVAKARGEHYPFASTIARYENDEIGDLDLSEARSALAAKDAARRKELETTPDVATQVDQDAKAPATHADPGESAEPVTPEVVAASVQKSADRTSFNPKEALAWILAEIDKAIAVAPTADQWKTLPAEKSKVTFDVPGDGKFTVQNNKDRLRDFRKQVAASKGFKAAPTKPPVLQRDTAGGSFSVRDMLDDGDLTAAYEFAKLKGEPLLFGSPAKAGERPIAYTNASPVELLHGLSGVVGRAWSPGSKGGKWAVIEPDTGTSFYSGAATADAAVSALNDKLKDESLAQRIKKMIESAGQPVGLNGVENLPRPTQDGMTAQWLEWAEQEQERADAQRAREYDAKRAKELQDADYQLLWERVGGDRSNAPGVKPWLHRDAATITKLLKAAEAETVALPFADMIQESNSPASPSWEAVQRWRDANKKKSSPDTGWVHRIGAGGVGDYVRSVTLPDGRKVEALVHDLNGRFNSGRLTLDGRVVYAPTNEAYVDVRAKMDEWISSWQESSGKSGEAAPDSATSERKEQAAAPAKSDEKKYAGPTDVSSRAGQMELANRAGRIASLLAMNEQLRALDPTEAWHPDNIKDASNSDLDSLQDKISQALVDAQRAKNPAEDEPSAESVPSKTAEGTTDNNWLESIFGTKEEQDAAKPAQDAKELDKQARADAAVAMLTGEIEANDATSAELAARKYKENRKQIELAGDGPGNQASMSVSAINESRRRRSLEALDNASSAMKRAAEAIRTDAEAFFSAVRDMEKRAAETYPGGSEPLDAYLDRAVGSLVEAGQYSGVGSAGRKLRMAAKAFFADAGADQSDDAASQDRDGTDDKLTPAQALKQTEWRDLGQRDGVKTHKLFFNEDGRSGAIEIARISQTGKGKWELLNADFDDNTARFENLREAKRAAEKRGIEALRRDGYVAGEDSPSKVAASRIDRPEPTGIATSEQSATKLDDFGKKLEGAAKDRMRAYLDRLGEAKDLDVMEHPLSVSFPEPDYKALIADGVDPFVVGWVRASRDEIPQKPRKAWKLKGWAAEVTLLRDVASKLLDGSISKEAMLEKLAGASDALRDQVGGRAELYQAVGHDVSLKDLKLEHITESFENGVRVSVENGTDYWDVRGVPERTAFSYWPKSYGKGKTREAAIADFAARYDAFSKKDAAGDKPKQKFTIYRYKAKPGEWIIGKKVGKRYVDLKSFDSAVEARNFLESGQKELQEQFDKITSIPSERGEENAPRVGGDHRSGADVTAEQFQETFGFRGGQFGASMPANERQENLNRTYDALMDLAGVLGVDPKALSLNGELGIAFGARGRGGKNAPAAHYEPDATGKVGDNNVVINLTRRNGPGALAHEWFHALDNYLARSRSEVSGFLSGKPYERGDGVRPELVAAFRKVMDAIASTGVPKRSGELDAVRTNDYWSSKEEMAARSFEAYIVKKLADQGGTNDYLANIVSKEYWDALEAMRSLAFLNPDAKQAETYPYPMADEMPKIEAAFDNLFDTIETKETDKGVAIYSLADGDPLPESQWMSAGQISELAQKLVEKFATDIPVRIVDKTDDAFRLAGVEGNNDFGAASGITLDGRIYLVREGLADEAAVGRTLFHELLHFGLRRFLTEGQYIAEMGKLRARDTAIKTYATAWAAGPEGQALAAQGKDQRYIIARGTDEALASLAEKVGTLETGYNKNGVVARAIRAVTNWLGALAERFGFHDAAASLRGVANREAMDYIRGVFGKLERGDAPGTFSTRWGYSDPAFKLSEGAGDEQTDGNKVGSSGDGRRVNTGSGLGSDRGVRRAAASDSASVDDAGTAFSLRKTPILKNSQVTQLFSWLAKFDEAFKQPTSHKKDIASIASEIDNGIKVRKWGSEFGDEFNDGRQPEVWELTGPNSKERSSYIFDDGRHVWVDVQFLLPGVDDGSKIYGIAAAYAHNNGKVLIGDPAGLSPTAFFRRTENMISSALKFGTTKHLQPHPAQVDPKSYYGQPGQHPDFANTVDGLGLDWREGDDEHNLRDMLLKSYHAAKRFTPDIEHIVYDFDRREFVDTRTGEGSGGIDGGYSSRPVDGGMQDGDVGNGLQRPDPARRSDGKVESAAIDARERGEGSGAAQGNRRGDRPGSDDRIGQFFARIPVIRGSRYSGGSATKARAALVNTLVRSPSGEGRANILASLVRQLSGQGLDPELQRTLYSLRTNPTTPGRITREDALAATAFIRDLTRIPVHVVESPSQAPREIQQSIRKQGATFKHVEGAFHRGEIWLFSDNLSSIERAREVLLHEGAHYGLRGMFGDRLDPMMLEIEDKNPSIREQVDRFLEMAPAPMPRVRAIEEVLVEMAAQGEATKLKGWPRFYAFIRNILRQMGFVKGWTQEDVQRLLGQAHEFWNSGKRPYYSHSMNGTALSQQEAANDDGSPDDDGPGGGVALSEGIARDVIRDRFNSQDNRSRIESTKEFMGHLRGKMETALKGSDKFGWLDKSIHTQLHKATKNPYFRAVFEGLQRFTNDASRAALRPAEMAPTVLPRIDVVSSLKPALKTILKGKEASADINAAFEAVLRGTLDKQTFGDAQAANLSPEQFKIYTEFRSAIDASLNELSAAEAYKVVRKLVPEVKEQVIDSPEQAKAIIKAALREKFDNKFAELQEAMPEIRTLDDARTLLKSDVVGYTPLTNEYATGLAKTVLALNDSQETIDEIFDRRDQLKSEGYAPLMRFGAQFVDVYRVDALGNRLRDENGDAITEYFGMFESEHERDQMAKRLRDEYADDPNVRVVTGTKSEEEWKQFKGVDPESVELFASRLGLEHDDVFQEWLRSATANRSTLKRLIHRKGTAGFSDDGARVLASFLTSNGRRSAQLYHNADVQTAIDAFPSTQGAEKDDAIRLNDYVQNPEEEAQGIKSLMFMHFLGGSVSNFFINLTQPGMVTLPYLSQFVGGAKASKILIDAYRMVRKPETMPDALKEALQQADHEGVVGAQEIYHLWQETARPMIGKMGGRDASYRLNAFMQLWGMPFALAEGINRKASFIGGWMAAKEQGLSDYEAYKAGAASVNETQFMYGKNSRPNWARGTIGALAFTFKTFSISYVELLVRMMRNGPQGRRAALYGIGLLFLASGLQGLPGSDDLDDLIDTIAQMLGYNVSSKAAKRKWLENLAGREVASVALYGLSSLTPLDLQSRMGIGNLIPATGIFMPSNQNKGASMLELIGPASSLAKSYMDTADAIGSGDWQKAGTAWMPKALRDASQGAIMAATGEYHDTRGRKVADVTPLDAALKAIGFQPQVIASESRAISSIQGRIDYMKKVQSVMTERWAEAIADRDSQGVADVLRAIKVWNEDNPDTPVAVKRSAVQRRVHDMQTSRKERFAKSVPASMRQGVMEEVN